MKKLYLGIICDKDGYAISHRSLLKVLLNPLLRRLGFEIYSSFTTTDEVQRYCGIGIHKIPFRMSRIKSTSFLFQLDADEIHIKEQRWW